MRSHTTSMATTGSRTEYSFTQIAIVTLALATTIVVGLLALTYPTGAMVFLAGGATAWVSKTLAGRLRAATRSDTERQGTTVGVTDEA